MKKSIIFDLDGVLVDSKDIHFIALNRALEEFDSRYTISNQDHKNIYDGLSTKSKLNILTDRLGLPKELHYSIWQKKQLETETLLKEIPKDKELISIIEHIRSKNIFVAVASNSIKSTIEECLKSIGIYELVDIIVSNEDVKNPKPHPEMYWKVMSALSITPKDSVIFEDSVIGLTAAKNSGANVFMVESRKSITMEEINKAIDTLSSSQSPWDTTDVNVLIPMAGAGSRFSDFGYSFPKPLIDVDGMPMIQAVVNNLSISGTYTYVVQKSHYQEYNLEHLLNRITPKCNIVQVDGITEGAAVTCLLAKEFIDMEKPLIIANSDQLLDWSSRDFMYDMYSKNADGGIVTFKSTHPKWSYAKTNSSNIVLEVAEKKTISDNATAGVYYWKRGSDFVKYAEKMISKNVRTNNEFYTCPVFNEAIEDKKYIYTYPIKKMWGTGTPEDLQAYLRRKND